MRLFLPNVSGNNVHSYVYLSTLLELHKSCHVRSLQVYCKDSVIIAKNWEFVYFKAHFVIVVFKLNKNNLASQASKASQVC